MKEFLEFLQKNISPKVSYLVMMAAVMVVLSIVMCVVHNSLLLMLLGVSSNEIGIGLYDLVNLVNTNQCLVILFLLLIANFVLLFPIAGVFCRFFVFLFLVISSYIVSKYGSGYLISEERHSVYDWSWNVLCIGCIIMAIIGGKETIEILIFGDKKDVPVSFGGKVISAFIIAILVLLFLWFSLGFYFVSQDLGMMFFEVKVKASLASKIWLIFISLSWWCYFYFRNSSKFSLFSLSVVILFYSLVQPVISFSNISENKEDLSAVEINLNCGDSIRSNLIKGFASGVIVKSEEKISFIRSDQIVSITFAPHPKF